MAAFPQVSFAKGEIAPELAGRVDTAAYRVSLRTARNVIIKTYGGADNRPGLQFIGFQEDFANPPRHRRFKFNTTDTYMLIFSNLKMRVVRNDALVTEPAKTITGISALNPGVVTLAGHGWSNGDDVVLSTNIARLTGRQFRVADATTNTFTLVDQITGIGVDTSLMDAFVSGTASRIYTLATPYAQADLATLNFVQSADVMTITHRNYAIRDLARLAHDNWTLTSASFAPSLAAPAGLGITVNSAGSETCSYVVTASATTTLEESLPSSPVSSAVCNVTADNTITWGAVTGAVKYSVYKAKNGVYGFIGDTPNLTFTDKNIAPALTTTPPQAVDPFVGPTNYPATSSYYEQRRVFGGSASKPDTSYYTQTGNYHNMNVSTPTQADDAITATLTSREVNEIRHFVPGNDLLVFTSGSEWRVNSGGSGAAFGADTLRQKPQSSWGCNFLEPIEIGLSVLFVTQNNISVRTFSYTYVSDKYVGNDLTLLAGHLFKQYIITDWAFQRSPDQVIYMTRSDGAALALTFQEEQQVTAWSPWDTSGKFECVDVVRPNADALDDAPYFCVRRTVNGRTVRYIEKLHSRRFTDVRDCFFVDSGLSYDIPVTITGIDLTNPIVVHAPAHGLANGDQVDLSDIVWVANVGDAGTETQPAQLNRGRFTVAGVTTDTFQLLGQDGTAFSAYVEGGFARKVVQTVTGLDHLEGRSVVALVDGNVVENLTVVNGAITMPRAFSRAHVGLSYTSDLDTMSLESPGQGTVQNKVKKASSIVTRFNLSRGLFIGPDQNNLIEIKQREFEDLGEPTKLLSGDKRTTIGATWKQEGRIFLRQKYPLPMSILAIFPDFETED